MSGALKEFSIGSPCPYQRLTINVLNDLLPLVGLSTSRMWVGLRQSLSSMKTVAGLHSIFLFLKRDGMLSAGPGIVRDGMVAQYLLPPMPALMAAPRITPSTQQT